MQKKLLPAKLAPRTRPDHFTGRDIAGESAGHGGAGD